MAYLLIVDDDEDFTNAVSMLLEDAGYEVRTEQDIDGGLESIKERQPDLLILDVMFPEDNSAGFELARTIRREENLKNIPILMLTAINVKFPLGFGQGDIDEDWLPVRDFLEKPVDLDVLKSKVAEMLEEAGS
jgi:CheY-like chemotaxis protein